MTSPALRLWSREVTTPACLTVKRTKPSSVGDEAMPKGASPSPKTDSSQNWPGV